MRTFRTGNRYAGFWGRLLPAAKSAKGIAGLNKLSLALDQTADVTASSVSDETLSGIVTEIDKTDSSGAY